MKGRSLRSYQLKFWLPLCGLLLFSSFLAATLWVGYQNALILAHERSQETILATLKKLQMSVENDLARNDMVNVEREIDYLDLRSETEAIALFDDRGHILISNHLNWRNKSSAQIELPEFDTARFDQNRQTFRIDLHYLPGKQLYCAYAPVHFPADPQSLRSHKIGALYYVYNHAYVENAVWRQIASNNSLIWLCFLLSIFLFWLAQDYFVTRPLKHLALFIQKIGNNDPDAANPLTGSGELMQLGQTLEQTHHSLQETLRALNFREQKLIVTLQSIGSGVIATDTGGLITRMNPAAEELTGWNSQEAIGEPSEKVFHIIHTESQRLIPSPVRQVLETRKMVRLSNQVLLHSRMGETFHIECNTAPILNETGSLYGVILTFADISDTYRLREQLIREKHHLQYILDNSATAIYSLLPNYRARAGFSFNYGSTRLEQLSGFSIRDWETKENLWRSRIHPDDLDRVEEIRRQIIKKGRAVFNYRFLHADGRYRWIEDHLMTLSNAAGEIYELMGSWVDITETKKTQQTNQLLGTMLDQSINEIQVIDTRTLRFVHVNQGGISNLGYGLNELVTMSLMDIYPEYDIESYARLIKPLLNGQQSQLQFETNQRRKDGSLYPVEVWLQLYRNAPDALVAIALDITQRREHEEKISRLNNFYAVLSRINQAIVQSTHEDELFRSVCNITAGLEQVRLTWIGKPDNADGTLIPVAAAGSPMEYLDTLHIPVDPDSPEGLGPIASVFRENRIMAINDFQKDPMTAPWHDTDNRRHGWQSSCAVPISLRQQPYAVLNLYSDRKDYFDSEVLELLAELKTDLSFALDSYARENARRISEQKLELSAKVFSQSRDAIVITDKKNRVISVNRAFTSITGYEEEDVLGKNPLFFSSGIQDKSFYREMKKSLIKNDFWLGELVDRRKDGTLFTEWLSISTARNENNEITHFIGIFTDITQLKVAKLQIEHLAHYDVLTDLPNRLLLKARVDHQIAVADRYKQTFALLFIDLDHFKNINDALGHTVGDQVLIEVGKRLLSAVREEDTVARVGGDEFNIQLTDTDWRGAAMVASHIIDLLAEPIHYQHYQLYIQPSIGISLYPENGENYETLTKNADTALYQAKTQGRNQYQFFTKEMQKQTQRRMEIEHQLRHALERNQLKIFYQAQIGTDTLRINGAEALLRWQHPEWGLVPPSEFIPVAEECGLILTIGDWVLEQAIIQAKRWHDDGFPITVAVNLSLAQFRANSLYDKVKRSLEQHQLPPRFLELELTESIAMQNVEAALEITRQLAELGIEISIDDFGIGYSSLNYLQQFSLHKLKIDQSFTREMVHKKESENIVDAIISLAKSLNLRTIAEGVESGAQFAMFRQKRCDEIQGYYFSKPVQVEEFNKLLKEGIKAE